MAAPIDFGGRESLLQLWTDEKYFDVDALIDADGNCPASFLQACFQLMKPVQNFYENTSRSYDKMDDARFVENFFAMEKWGNDNIPVAGETFREFVKKLYQRNELVRGEFRLGDNPVELERITCPLLLLTARATTWSPRRRRWGSCRTSARRTSGDDNRRRARRPGGQLQGAQGVLARGDPVDRPALPPRVVVTSKSFTRAGSSNNRGKSNDEPDPDDERTCMWSRATCYPGANGPSTQSSHRMRRGHRRRRGTGECRPRDPREPDRKPVPRRRLPRRRVAERSLANVRPYPRIGAVPVPIDVAVISSRRRSCPISWASASTPRYAARSPTSAGFREAGPAGPTSRRRSWPRRVGVECGSSARFQLRSHVPVPRPEHHARRDDGRARACSFLSQSSALCSAVLDWSLRERIGLSTLVSVGSMLDVRLGRPDRLPRRRPAHQEHPHPHGVDRTTREIIPRRSARGGPDPADHRPRRTPAVDGGDDSDEVLSMPPSAVAACCGSAASPTCS